MKRDILFWMLVPFASTAYQLCIKFTVGQMGDTDFGIAWLLLLAHTPWMLAALACEAVAFVAWMKILSTHTLSGAFPLTSLIYILVMLASWCVFKEPVVPLQLIGGALILAGVWCIGRAMHEEKAHPSDTLP